MKVLLGKKLGMTQIFLEDGRLMPVTVLQLGPCPILQVKTPEKDGYTALQIGFGERREKNVNKPDLGVSKKAGVKAQSFIQEVRVEKTEEYKPGQNLTVGLFDGVKKVDVTGVTKGRGFAGVVKRHGFGGGPKTHGQSDRQRAPGALGRMHSISQGVLKGKRMCGHFGTDQRTIKNIAVVKLDAEKNLMFIHGATPGPTGSFVRVAQAKSEVCLIQQGKFNRVVQVEDARKKKKK